MFEKTLAQQKAIDVMSEYTTTMLEGGSRSGKSVILVYGIIVRALKYPGSQHLMARLRLSHAKISLWMNTVPFMLNAIGIKNKVTMNNSDFFIELIVNNQTSRIWCAGLDDKERTEKILGNEYATIFVNEASQISFNTYEVLKTRLNAPVGVPPRFWLDQNPPSKRHWTYKLFHERVLPDGRPVEKNDYGCVRLNPADNKKHLNEAYINILEGLSGAKRARFLLGEYGTDDIGALWKRDWIKYKKPPQELLRVVIGVDPSGSVNGDAVGIVAAGIDSESQVYVLGDYSINGTPEEWSSEVKRAYDLHSADAVIAEKNYGGDMVEAVINGMGTSNMNVELVTASRGKAIRAEPISAMYSRGEVYHAYEMTDLEDEYCTWRQGDASPNHLDAAVWAITSLTEEGGCGELNYV